MRHSVSFIILCLAWCPAAAEEKPAPPKLLVPAYFYPAGDGLAAWDRLIGAAKKSPLVVIVNPASGPGERADPNYAAAIKRAKAAKITLVGYVSTNYARRKPDDVNADMDAWMKLYPGLDGFFFDEQTSGPEKVDHYADLARHARGRIPKGLIVANPGTAIDEGYLKAKTADVWCVYEGNKPPDEWKPPEFFSRYPRDRFAVLSYAWRDRSRVKPLVEAARTRGAGYVFITDDVLPNPWDTLPPYWDDLVDAAAPR